MKRKLCREDLNEEDVASITTAILEVDETPLSNTARTVWSERETRGGAAGRRAEQLLAGC
jgi:hypothetical protein